MGASSSSSSAALPLFLVLVVAGTYIGVANALRDFIGVLTLTSVSVKIVRTDCNLYGYEGCEQKLSF